MVLAMYQELRQAINVQQTAEEQAVLCGDKGRGPQGKSEGSSLVAACCMDRKKDKAHGVRCCKGDWHSSNSIANLAKFKHIRISSVEGEVRFLLPIGMLRQLGAVMKLLALGAWHLFLKCATDFVLERFAERTRGQKKILERKVFNLNHAEGSRSRRPTSEMLLAQCPSQMR